MCHAFSFDMGHKQITTLWIRVLGSILQLVCTETSRTRQYLLNLFVQTSDVAVLLSGTFIHLHGFHTRVIPAHMSQYPTLHIPTVDTRHSTPLYTHSNTGHTSWHPNLHIATLDTRHSTQLYTHRHCTHASPV